MNVTFPLSLTRGVDSGGRRPALGGGGQGGYQQAVQSKLSDGTVLCHFFQSGTCNSQKDASCTRKDGVWKHLCAYKKGSGDLCGGSHMKVEHDVSKHGR